MIRSLNKKNSPVERFENSVECLNISTILLLGKWGDGPT
jgi:hypothetical protein